MSKTYDVKVKAPPRPGFPGFYSAQRFFPNGEAQSITVNGRELKELLDDEKQGFISIEGADGLRDQLKNDPDVAGGSVQNIAVTPEELAALEAFRAQKASGTASVQVPMQTTTPASSESSSKKGK